MPFADLGERRLHYVRRGTGAPLLLIQGMAGHHRMWGERFLSLLEADFDIVAFDHRGIGASDRADEEFTVGDLAEDAAGVLRAVGWDDAHVLGISLGGMIAQELAVRHPDVIRTLTLGCTYAGPAGGTLEAPGPRRLFEAIHSGDARLSLQASYEANLSPAYREGDHFGAFLDLTLAERVPAPVIMMQMRAALAHDAESRLREFDKPTLVIHGSADEMITPGNGPHVAGLVPGARLEQLDGVGHLFWLERPELTAELVRAHAVNG
ncbi:alpha/beta fold hydrolase [Actinokineospora sp. NBRC 105648]|uniref:alpha/beta fold hydrolase n=1 Tax=Actinokineospora sp. NBRC 105648 TaxID=3032206 RepID=UPI0024A2211C|nr:alpha/beta fold hydrolase [Actinokineospora sp. NBRC 105648]GLZ41402.1 3-oxoadipate enol-lactonase [Actinokineospora sp. NBRC 105648]